MFSLTACPCVPGMERVREKERERVREKAKAKELLAVTIFSFAFFFCERIFPGSGFASAEASGSKINWPKEKWHRDAKNCEHDNYSVTFNSIMAVSVFIPVTVTA